MVEITPELVDYYGKITNDNGMSDPEQKLFKEAMYVVVTIAHRTRSTSAIGDSPTLALLMAAYLAGKVVGTLGHGLELDLGTNVQ